MKTAKQLQKNIMKRIYYAYAIMLALHPRALRLYLLAFGFIVLAKLVHIYAVYQSFTHVQVGGIGTYLLGTLVNADWPTLAVLFFVSMVLLSFRIKIPKIQIFSQIA